AELTARMGVSIAQGLPSYSSSRISYNYSMKAVVSEKGQVTIPKKLRDSLGIRPGQTLDFEEESGTLVARKLLSDEYRKAIESVRGILKDEWPGYTTDEILKEMRGYT